MKTSITKITATVLTLTMLMGSALTLKAADQTITVLSEVKKVNKIKVSGNVELILVQSNDESVKVYDSYYAKNALVQQEDGELRISSYNKEPLTVVAYVRNLTSISAANNASVKTFGKFQTLDLSVELKDNATADLNTNTFSLATHVADNASLTLSGSTADYTAVVNGISKVNMNQFVAENTNFQSQNAAPVAIANVVPVPSSDEPYSL